MGHKLTWRWTEQSVLPAGECHLPHACATAACPGTGSPCSAWLHWQKLNPHVNHLTLHQNVSWMEAQSGNRYLHCCVLPRNWLTLLALGASWVTAVVPTCMPEYSLGRLNPIIQKHSCCCAVTSAGGEDLQTQQIGICSLLRSCDERCRASRRA